MVLRAPFYCDFGELFDALFRGSPLIPFTPQ
jgi:hypothetical protein